LPSETRSADEPASLKFISSCSSRTEVFSVRSEDTCPLIRDDPCELRAIRRETSSLRSDDTPQRGRFPFRIGSGDNRGLVLFPFCPSLSCVYNATEVHAAIDMPRSELHRTSANMLKFHKIASSTLLARWPVEQSRLAQSGYRLHFCAPINQDRTCDYKHYDATELVAFLFKNGCNVDSISNCRDPPCAPSQSFGSFDSKGGSAQFYFCQLRFQN
jgi:hypothetical protein